MFFNKLTKLLFLIFCCLISPISYACSSCGSSATSPLVMYPGENFKFYFGLSQNYNFKMYGLRNGDATSKHIDKVLLTKTTATLAVGYRTSENTFVTFTQPIVMNEGLDENSDIQNKFLLGDPIISGRYNILNSEISEEFKPQIQVLASFKPKVAKNMLDNDPSELNTTGNGYHQLSAGLDFWWGMPFIQFGGSQFVTYSFARKTDGLNDTRDLQYTTILTGGHAFTNEHFQLQAGLVLDYIGQNHTDTKPTGPSQQSNSIFATLNWNVTPLDFVRFSYSYGGAIGGPLGIYTNSRQTTSTMILVAYERTFF